jgi:hypothetical protein
MDGWLRLRALLALVAAAHPERSVIPEKTPSIKD